MKPVVPHIQGLRFTETTNPGRRSRWSLARGWHNFAPLGLKSQKAQLQNSRVGLVLKCTLGTRSSLLLQEVRQVAVSCGWLVLFLFGLAL